MAYSYRLFKSVQTLRVLSCHFKFIAGQLNEAEQFEKNSTENKFRKDSIDSDFELKGKIESMPKDNHDRVFLQINVNYFKYQFIQFVLLGPVQLFFKQTYWDHKIYIKFEDSIFAYEISRFVCLLTLLAFLLLASLLKQLSSRPSPSFIGQLVSRLTQLRLVKYFLDI